MVISRKAASSLPDTGSYIHDLVRSAFDLASVGMAVCQPNGRMLLVNDSLREMLGHQPADLIARPWRDFIAVDGSGLTPGPSSAVPGFGPQRVYLRGREGMVRAYGALQPIPSADGLASHLLVTIWRIDGSPNHRDPLTGLPDRHLLEQHLQWILAMAANLAQPVGILSLGLDRFRNVNDSLGRGVGDSVLQRVARLLNDAVADGGMVARTGGDQFVVVLPGLDCARVAAQASDIRGRLSHSQEIEGHLVCAPASIGIAMFPHDGGNAVDLLASADAALHDAKARDHACRFFTVHLKQAALQRVTLEAKLRRAIENEQFELHYQPKLCILTGQLSGAEALIRWRCPDRGLISPADFIPIAEESGLIVSLGEWVLHEGLRQVAQWRREHDLMLTLAVNVSPAQLVGEHSMKWITAALERNALSPELLEIEMTESAMMKQVDGTIVGLRELVQLGVKLAVDDFGTGYSNLSQLGLLPITTIKIDRSLIASIAHRPKDAAIVRAVIEMAHALGTRVVAEGVETAEQVGVLRMARCDFIQGYVIAKPLPADAFLTWTKMRLQGEWSMLSGTGT